MFISELQRVRRPLVENEDLAIQVAIDRERKRIARDLHDGVVQQITYVVHKLEFIQRQLEMQQTPAALSEMKHAHSVLRDSLDDLRHSITSLVPDQLEKGGLAAALETLIYGYRLDYPDLELSCDIVEPRKLPSVLEVPIFRVVQEA
ncbi:MAG TPA: histidine kinase, partial [Ktedonobacteraceae bacterium]|nr:histidine kinase [Ktedonobacteraceae bacterium]